MFDLAPIISTASYAIAENQFAIPDYIDRCAAGGYHDIVAIKAQIQGLISVDRDARAGRNVVFKVVVIVSSHKTNVIDVIYRPVGMHCVIVMRCARILAARGVRVRIVNLKGG